MKSGATETSYHYLFQYYTPPENVIIHHNPAELVRSEKPFRVLWAHHGHDQPINLNIREQIKMIDLLVCVSEWSKQQYMKYLKIPEWKVTVIPNGCSDIFVPAVHKSPTFIHTSIPYKALPVFPDLWKIIHSQRPQAKLKIFSSMNLYGEDMQDHYQELYDYLKRMPGVEYSESIDQKELVAHYQDAAFFIHPNIWEETFCVSMIEAMRCGCYPIISDIGALPETSGELANIIKMHGEATSRGWIPSDQFINNFAQSCIDVLDIFESNRQLYNKTIQTCSNYVCEKYDWKKLAEIWKTTIESIPGVIK